MRKPSVAINYTMVGPEVMVKIGERKQKDKTTKTEDAGAGFYGSKNVRSIK